MPFMMVLALNPAQDIPLLGIKSVDSTAMHVLGGLAKNNTTYIQKILAASKGRVPFDVINIHTYCTDDKDGYSPENENFGLEKNLSVFMDWCKKTLPNIPVWLTEFGWDTYSTPAQHSYVFAPAPQQANYIIRSYFVALKMGFEKAFMFMDKDPDSSNVLQYSSSGIITDQASGLTKKPSFYYMATLQKTWVTRFLTALISYRHTVRQQRSILFRIYKQQPGNRLCTLDPHKKQQNRQRHNAQLHSRFGLSTRIRQPDYFKRQRFGWCKNKHRNNTENITA